MSDSQNTGAGLPEKNINKVIFVLERFSLDVASSMLIRSTITSSYSLVLQRQRSRSVKQSKNIFRQFLRSPELLLNSFSKRLHWLKINNNFQTINQRHIYNTSVVCQGLEIEIRFLCNAGKKISETVPNIVYSKKTRPLLKSS